MVSAGLVMRFRLIRDSSTTAGATCLAATYRGRLSATADAVCRILPTTSTAMQRLPITHSHWGFPEDFNAHPLLAVGDNCHSYRRRDQSEEGGRTQTRSRL